MDSIKFVNSAAKETHYQQQEQQHQANNRENKNDMKQKNIDSRLTYPVTRSRLTYPVTRPRLKNSTRQHPE